MVGIGDKPKCRIRNGQTSYGLAIATLRACLYGTLAEEDYGVSGFRRWQKPQHQKLSVFRKGRIRFLAALLRGLALDTGCFIPHDGHKTPL